MTSEEWTGIEAANKWLEENYEPPTPDDDDDEEDGGKMSGGVTGTERDGSAGD